jgi:hypothetical protein
MGCGLRQERIISACEEHLGKGAKDWLSGVNYFFRRRQLFLPVLSLHHWSTIAQSDAKGVRSSVSEFC